MASYSTSTTGSIKYIPVNLSASEGLTINIDNPLQGSSYVVLETRKDADGKYTAFSPKNAQGTYTLSNITKEVHDDYKAGFVVPPGGGTVTFDNTNYVSGSEFRIQGTEYRPFYDALLDRWPNAAAAYSLRLLNSYYEGPAIRVRRSLDDTESNIGFSGGQLDTTTLTNFTTNAGTALPGDYGDGPAAAYSLRYVVSSYSGPVIRVRRSSDDIEQDFTPSQITDGTLESFCGAGNGFVSVWYDQSGNGNHATQATDANQPQIVSSGNIHTVNNKKSILFDGGFLTYNSSFINVYAFTVSKLNTYTELNTLFNTTVNGDSGNVRINTGSYYRAPSTLGEDLNDYTYTDGEMFFNTSLHTTADNALNQHQLSIKRGITGLNTGLTIGTSKNNNRNYKGHIQELIFYPSDQSSNRTDIESNINNYYNIFPFNGYVKTWYDQSGNGRDATQTTAANQPQIVSSGSVITQGSKPIIKFTSNTQILNTVSFALSVNRTYVMTLFNQINTTPSYKVYLGAVAGGSDNFVNGLNGPFASSNNVRSYIGSGTSNNSVGTGAMANGSYVLLGAYIEGSVQHQHYRNGVLNAQNISLTISPTTNSQVQSIMFTAATGNDLRTNEAIIWDSYQSSNRTGIESNINSHYNIY